MFPHPRHQLLQCCSAACCINTSQEKNWPRCCRQWWPDMQVMFDDVAFRRNFHQNFCTLLRNFYKFVFYKLYPTEIGLLVQKTIYQQAVGLTKSLLKPKKKVQVCGCSEQFIFLLSIPNIVKHRRHVWCCRQWWRGGDAGPLLLLQRWKKPFNHGA